MDSRWDGWSFINSRICFNYRKPLTISLSLSTYSTGRFGFEQHGGTDYFLRSVSERWINTRIRSPHRKSGWTITVEAAESCSKLDFAVTSIRNACVLTSADAFKVSGQGSKRGFGRGWVAFVARTAGRSTGKAGSNRLMEYPCEASQRPLGRTRQQGKAGQNRLRDLCYWSRCRFLGFARCNGNSRAAQGRCTLWECIDFA